MSLLNLFTKTISSVFVNKNMGSDKLECPHCFVALNKLPDRKTKCLSCQNYMYSRTSPTSNKKVVVTKEQAENIDKEWSVKNGTYVENNQKKIYELSWLRGEKSIVNSYSDTLRMIGVTEQDIFERRQKFTNIKDTIWSFCNENLLKNQENKNYDNLISIYYIMERIRVSENKTANYLVKKRLYYQLLNYKKMGCDIVIITTSSEACEACKKLDGKELNINEAIKNQILPPADCTCLRCCCSY